jgi:polysaccharide biosynthesis protein PslH
MRILQICFRMPYPLKDGGAIAMFNITKGLLDEGCELTLIVPETEKHPVDYEKLPEIFSKLQGFHCIKLDTEISGKGALLNLFSSKPYYLSRYESKDFEKKLRAVLETSEFDFILIESLKMSMYLPLIRQLSKSQGDFKVT